MEENKTKIEKEIDIEEILCSGHGKLYFEGKTCAKAIILDEELDEFECNFNNDGCVEINTDGCAYITLSVEKLQSLIKLVKQAEKHYNGLTDEEWENEMTHPSLP